MSIVDKVLDIIENDLNIKISKKKKQIIYDKFYPDIKDKIYWSYRIENSFYEGIISKEEYEKTTRVIQTAYTLANGCFRPGRRASGEAGSRGSSGVRAVGGGVQRSPD